MAEQDGAERNKSRTITPLRGLLPFIAPYRRRAWAAGGALVVTALLSLLLPLAVRQVIDGFSADRAAALDQYFLLAIGIAALLALFTALRFTLVTGLGERVVADIRRAVYDRVIGLSPAFYQRIMTAEVVTRLTTDTTLILSVLSSSISFVLRHLLMMVGGLIFMLFTSAKLTALVLLLVPVVIVPILALGRRLRQLSRESQDRIAASSVEATEGLQAAQAVQANGHEAASRHRFGTLTEAAFETARVRIKIRALMTAIIIFMIFSGVVGVLWIGASDVRSGAMSPGTLVQFLLYSVMVAGAVAATSEIYGELQRAAGATERLMELLAEEDPITDPDKPVPLPSPVRGALRLEQVGFSYPARPGIAALSEIDLTIAPGETVALVGPSGAGKSTLFQLLLRFFDPQSGRILLDGVPIRDMARAEFRRAFALVPQEPVIFAASAAENIRFGRPDASDAEVEAAARAAAAHDFIAALPEGYDSYVGERGVMLSGGQKQRIAIARAILRDAPVLLLDEATSALDAASEAAVQGAVERLSAGRTSLVIAHRLATVKKADRILVMSEGKVVARGTHTELIRDNGLYADLARMQFLETAGPG